LSFSIAAGYTLSAAEFKCLETTVMGKNHVSDEIKERLEFTNCLLVIWIETVIASSAF
jgi:hypothetical protein